MIYLITGYMWLFIHRPFEVWPWLGALRIERIYMLMTLVCWLFFATKTWTNNRINLGIGFLVATVCLATFFSDYASFHSLLLQDWFKVLVFFYLVMATVREEKELRIIMVAFVVIMGLYELHSLREFFCGRGVYRMGTWRMVGINETLSDPNSFAATVNYGIPILLPVVILAKKKWHYRALVALFALAIGCILLTGSRSGFISLLLLMIGVGLFSKYRWRLVPFLAAAAPLVWLYLPADLQNRYLTLIDPSRGPLNAQTSAESRMNFFSMALDIWEKNPFLGAGPGAFSIESGTGMQSHSLYAQTVSGLGLVGAFAVMVLVFCYINNFREGRRIYQNLPPSEESKFLYFVLVAVTIGVAQLLFLGLAGHNLFRFTWLWYAAFSALALKFLRQRQVDALKERDSAPDKS